MFAETGPDRPFAALRRSFRGTSTVPTSWAAHVLSTISGPLHAREIKHAKRQYRRLDGLRRHGLHIPRRRAGSTNG